MFPGSSVILGMSKHKFQQHRLVRIVDFADETVRISLDVEDSAYASQICVREFLPRFSEVIPLCFLAYPVPTS
jgi:hypothetical protein